MTYPSDVFGLSCPRNGKRGTGVMTGERAYARLRAVRAVQPFCLRYSTERRNSDK